MNAMRLWLLIVVFASCSSNTFCADIITTNGVTYNSITITSSDVFGVKILHKSGVAYVPFAEMTDSDKKTYGYDSKKEEAVIAERLKLKAAAEEKAKAESQSRAIQQEKLSKSYFFRGKVVQVVNDGVILNGKMWTYDELQDAYKKYAIVKKLRQRSDYSVEYYAGEESLSPEVQERHILSSISTPVDANYFVAGIKNSLADDETWKGVIYYAGLYKYINTQGANKTIRAFATSQELADKVLKNE